jgi:NTP pyrophosphatase (non-canonical NTP hydrolase)
MANEFESLTRAALQFRDKRNWKQFHNFKDMALSMSLEVAELIELMQWKNGPELESHLEAQRDCVGQELSDILYWVLVIANDLQIDLPEAFLSKLKANAIKYPIEKAHGQAKKYTELK